ncbi:sphingosine kinase 1-like [Mytilus californianus]|uniref:sphingosine kinase 1-like n=1 Tax=Mytilus californianus TaxID=6549 RepID=UPI0022479F86|nr:sphingosine kinase 1-like [Mytilus californianus]
MTEQINMENKTQVLLEGYFFLFPLRLTKYDVKLTKQGITFYELQQKKNVLKTEKSIHFGDVVGCRCKKGKSENDPSAYFSIFSYQFKGKSKRKRSKYEFSFGLCDFQNFEDNLKVCQKWRNVIVCLSRNIVVNSNEVEFCMLPPSPTVLVLINPHSGPGKAQQIFESTVKPMLDDADIDYKVLITEYAGHASEVVKTLKLEDWSGLVIVSGDGLIYEVINGLMSRKDWAKAIKFPIGCLPGGSGNALCCSVNYLAGEPMDPDMVLHSTFVLIKHKILPIDLVLLQTPTDQIYSFLSVAWGIIADIDYESEKLRSIGSTRFTLYTIMRILKLRTYRARVSFLPVSDQKLKENGKSSKTVKFPRPRRYTIFSNDSNQEALNSVYNVGCVGKFKSLDEGDLRIRSQSMPTNMSDYMTQGEIPTNSLTSKSDNKLYEENEDEDSGHHSGDEALNGDVENGLVDFNLNSTTNEVFEDSVDETISMITESADPVPSPLLSPLDEDVPNTWTTVEDDFVTALAIYLPYLGPDNLVSPDSKLNDGCINLMLVRKGVSKNELLNIFLQFTTGEHINSPAFEVIKCLAFRLVPLTEKGNIMVDGERIDYGPIQGQILPGLARIMAIQ